MTLHTCPNCNFFLLSVDEAREAKRYGLTPRQAECLKFIREFSRDKGYPPSHVEIAKGLGYAGQGSRTDDLIKALEERGRIKRHRLPNGRVTPRSIEVLT